MDMATQRQIEYATDMIEELGYDINDYDLNSMTKQAISELINDLKEEMNDGY